MVKSKILGWLTAAGVAFPVGGALWSAGSETWNLLWGIKQAQLSMEITIAKQAIAVNGLTMALSGAKEDRAKENAEQTSKIEGISQRVVRIENQIDWLIWQRRGDNAKDYKGVN